MQVYSSGLISMGAMGAIAPKLVRKKVISDTILGVMYSLISIRQNYNFDMSAMI